jgi:hypothetical protein
MGSKDVGDLQAIAAPCGGRQAGGDCPVRFAPNRSNGLMTSRIVLTATRV